jgi:choice-of-anchor B domain-containing protein
MKQTCITFILILLVKIDFLFGQAYDALNVTLLGQWQDSLVTSEPQFNSKYSSCYGWVHPTTGKEYGIIGSGTGTNIIDISNPTQPNRVAFVAGRRDSCIWREYKTFRNYLYAVSDDPGDNSFQIIDLSYLPDSVHVVRDDQLIFKRSHTIFIDGNKLYGGTVSTANSLYSMAVYSLNDPENPVLLAKLNDFYPNLPIVHDMFVRNDTVYASCGFEKFYIFKFDSIQSSFSMIGNLTSYPEAGYNHSSYLTDDGRYLVMADEVPVGLGLKMVDVQDFSNIGITQVFRSTVGPTPHNPYIKNNHAIVSYYLDGVQIFDLSDPQNIVRTGYLDTHPQNGNSYSGQSYNGCWGVYAFFPSGNMIASDMQNGLFVFNPDPAISSSKSLYEKNELVAYPNPSNAFIRIKDLPNWYDLRIFSSDGQAIHPLPSLRKSGGFDEFDLKGLRPGIYFFRFNTGDNILTYRVLKL